MKIYFSAGLNEQDSPNLAEAAKGSYNFELSKDSYKLLSRSPFDLSGTVPSSNAIGGFMQLIKRDDSETTLVQAGADVYEWSGGSTFSSRGTCATSSRLRDVYWSLDEYLIITDMEKATPVKTWNGTTFGTLTTGLAGTLYAKYGIVHRGRAWLFNLTEASTDLSHVVVASQFEDPTSYDTTIQIGSGTLTVGTEAFYMTTPDLRPINGVVLFQNTIVISTEGGRLFRLTGNDSTDYAWTDFYVKSNSIGDESLENIGNDVVYMRQGGNIESLTSTDRFGDVSADDLSRWIPESVRGLTGAITIYDQDNQKVFFFVQDKVLVLFKDILYGGALLSDKGDKANLSPWSVYVTQDSSEFNTVAAKYMRKPGETGYTVYWGGSTGRVMDMNGVGTAGDADASSIQTVRKTRFLERTEGFDFLRSVTRGNVRYRRKGQATLYLDFDWGDEYNVTTVQIGLKGISGQGAKYWGGAYYWGDDIYWGEAQFDFAEKVSHQNFSAIGKGTGTTLTVYTAEDYANYEVFYVEIG